jgi:hypothetical protein
LKHFASSQDERQYRKRRGMRVKASSLSTCGSNGSPLMAVKAITVAGNRAD